MVPEKSPSCSSKPAICPYPKPDESSPYLTILLAEDQFSCYASVLGREFEEAKESEFALSKFELGNRFH